MAYNIYDTQCEKYISENVTEEFVRGYAFHIVEDRAIAEDDDLGREFKKIVEQGKEAFSLDSAKGILEDWEYKLEEVNK